MILPKLKRRRLIGLLSAVALLAVIVWLALAVILPAIVRRQIAGVLKQAGFENVSFHLNRVSLWETEVSGIASAEQSRLQVASVLIRYTPLQALRGRIETVQVRDGDGLLDLSKLPTTQPRSSGSSDEPPVQRIDLRNCILSIRSEGIAAELPLDAELIRAPLGAATVSLHGASLLSKGDVDAEFHGIDAALAFQSLRPLKTLALQKLTASQVKLAGQEFTDVAVTYEVKAQDLIEISSAKLNWCGGQLSTASPVVVRPPSSEVELAVQVDHLNLEQFLAVITKGRAAGTGSVSGRIPMHLKGSQVTLWQGRLESDGPGTLRVGQLSRLSEILDQSDARFKNDPTMQQVKQQIIAAMTDFEYDKLSAEPTRAEAELVVKVHIQGHGRTGAKQPLDITLNLRGLEESLSAYLQVTSRVFRIGRR